MRLDLALALLAATTCASAAAAQPSEDRYGPRRAEPVRVLASNAAYQGRMLNWSSRAFVPQIPESSPQPAAPAVEAPSPPVVSRPARPVAVARPVQAAARAPVQATLPDSLYAPPPPPAAPPQRMAAVAAPAAPSTTGSPPRLYSVHRQYGLSPDAIPATPRGSANYVLIGPREGVGGEGDKASKDGESDDDRPF